MTLTVVTGSPCSGKSTYIAQRAKPGDIVIDLDRLALALTVEGTRDHGYADHIRNVAIGARAAAVSRALLICRRHDVWIIQTQPTARERALYASLGGNVVRIDPGQAVCLERASRLRPEVAPLIRAFYAGRMRRPRGRPSEIDEMSS